MSSEQGWLVRLGREHWQRYTYERTEPPEFKLLGSVTRGPAVGALALMPDGRYVQVNGDYLSPLPTGCLRRAVAKAGRIPPQWTPPGTRRDLPKPQITVKRRRVFARS